MKNVITQITLILIILAETLTAQTDTNKINEILFGTFLPSSPVNRTRWEMGDSTLKNIGFNTAVQYYVHPMIYADLISGSGAPEFRDNRQNIESSSFKYIIALNTLAQFDPNDQNRLDSVKTDWVRAFTTSMYNEWEAEQDGPYYHNPLYNGQTDDWDRTRMDRNEDYTEIFHDIDEKVVKSNNYLLPEPQNLTSDETWIVRGPYAFQDRVHKFRYRDDPKFKVKYHLKLRMKISKKPLQNIEICKIRVIQQTWKTVKSNGIPTPGLEYSDTLMTFAVNSELIQQGVYFDAIEPSLTYTLNDRGAPARPSSFPETDGADTSRATKIYYEVTVNTNHLLQKTFGDIYIDKFTVWDDLIWEQEYANDNNNIVRRLNFYRSNISNGETNAYRKIKYFHTLGEPHAWDNFLPYRKTDSLTKISAFGNDNIGLFTSLYPEWIGTKEGVNVPKTWGEVTKPKKYCFWYYTIFPDNGSTLSSQIQLRTRAIEAATYDKDFYYTAQAWGTKDTLGNWEIYRTPTGTEALGQTMTVLAFGCKGLLYETYYSYLSVNSLLGGKYYVSGIVGWMNDTSDITNFYKIRPNDRSLYDTLVSIGERLKGPLGKTLYGLYFDGQHIYRDLNNVTHYFNISDIKISDNWGTQQEKPLNLVGITKLNKKSGNKQGERYYFMYNINTRIPDGPLQYENRIEVEVKSEPNKNFIFYNIEDSLDENYPIYSNGLFQYIDRIELGPGGGKLFRLARKAAYRGDLSLSETIELNEQLTSEGKIVIPENVTLTIEGTYNLVDTLLVETGGKLQINPGGRIIMKEGSSIYCSGEITAEGTESNRAVIDFSIPDPQKYNSIHLSPPAKLVLKNTDLKNGYTAVNALAGYDSLLIENCKFSNFADAAINLNGDGTEMAKIVSNRYSSCVYPVYATNLQTLLVKDDSASVSAGYYAGSVTDARISGTKITGTGSGIGIHFSGINSGYVQGNTITGCNEGIHLSNASVKLGRNIITGNGSHGIKAESGSEADMRKYFDVICGSTSMSFPVSGYNEITGNGTNAAEANEGTEIFVENSSILLSEGGNRISDENMTEMNQMLLINGKSNDDPVHAEGNFWGESAPGGENFDVNAAVITSPELTIFNPVENHACSIRLSVPGYGIYDTLPAIENYEGETEMMMYAQNLYESGSYDSAYTTYTALYAQATEKEKLQVLKGMFISGIKTSLKQSRLASVQYLADSLMQTTSDTVLTANLRRLRVYLLAEGGNLEGAVMTAGENVAYMQGETDIFNAETEQITLEMRGSPVSGAITQKSQWALTSENAERSKKLKERNRRKYIIKKATENSTEIITDYMLYQNYPNPFNAGTVIRYDMREAGEVNIKVYDILGREVRELVNERKEKGRYSIGFTPNELASGIYIFSMRTGTYQNARKMIIMK